jgi:SRSO17 transposase
MQLPLVNVAPIVLEHGEEFRDVFANCKQYRHFVNYLTGLITLENKSMANMARCILDSADKTNLSRYLSESGWREDRLNDRRVSYMLEQTKSYQTKAEEAALLIDDTLCEHVGNLFEFVDQHYNHGNGQYPLAHNLVTSYFLSGPVRFPVDMRLYRRHEEFTDWEGFVAKHFPGETIPKKKAERHKFHKRVDAKLLEDLEFQKLDQAFQTKIALAIELVEKAAERCLAFGWVLFDGWYLAPDFLAALNQLQKDWISILKQNRNLETNSFQLRDENDQPISLPGPLIKVSNLVPLIPKQAFKPITLSERIYYTFTLTVRIPTIGKVRIVISFDNAELQGNYVVLVTNRLDCNAKRILETYLRRWPIETFYQDSKQLLGLDEYRMRTAQAFQKHWSLVFVAYSLLHLDCLTASLSTKQSSPIKSIGEAARQQAMFLIQDLLLYAHSALESGHSVLHLFDILFAKQKPIPT